MDLGARRIRAKTPVTRRGVGDRFSHKLKAAEKTGKRKEVPADKNATDGYKKSNIVVQGKNSLHQRNTTGRQNYRRTESRNGAKGAGGSEPAIVRRERLHLGRCGTARKKKKSNKEKKKKNDRGRETIDRVTQQGARRTGEEPYVLNQKKGQKEVLKAQKSSMGQLNMRSYVAAEGGT